MITDESWIEKVKSRSARPEQRDFVLENLVEKLRISSYPRYSLDDVVCGISAAFIQDLPLFGITQPLIHIANPSRRLKTSIVSRTTRLVSAEDTVRLGKMTLTSPVRTSLDLIDAIGDAGAFAAMETVLRRAAFGSAEAADGIGRIGYPPDVLELRDQELERLFLPALDRMASGQNRARRLIGGIGVLSESYAESRCSYNLMLLGHRSFKQQAKITDGRRQIARVDFLDEDTSTVLFVDGAAKYLDNGHRLIQKEATQFNRLVALGYRIVRFTFSEVLNLEDFATKLYGQAPWLRAKAATKREVEVRT